MNIEKDIPRIKAVKTLSTLVELYPKFGTTEYDYVAASEWVKETFSLEDYQIRDLDSLFDGARVIDDQISVLTKIRAVLTRLGWDEIRLSYDTEYDSSSRSLMIQVLRDETDEEYEARIPKILAARENGRRAAAAKKKKAEDKERELYETLKRKYGSTDKGE